MGGHDLRLESRVEAGPDVYAFRTVDGLASTDAFRPAELALLGSVVPDPDDDVLVVDANYGVVGCVLADAAPGGRTVLTETSARAARCCERNLDRNGCDAAVAVTGDVGDPDAGVRGRLDGAFDVAAYAPYAYDPVAVVAERCCGALDRLRAGGELFVAAGTDEGARRYRDALGELVGDVERVAEEGDVRVYRARKGDFAPRAFVDERRFDAEVRGVAREFVTRPGLFSAGHLDGGTRHLLAALPVRDGDRVLDLACGYGPVGLFAAGFADCDVRLTDDDAVAASYARRNADRNGVDVRDVVTADAHRGVADRTFDLVASNPPTHAGDGVLADCFRGAREVLAPAGRFALVYNDVLGFEDRLGELFHEVEVSRAEDGFHVTVARRPR